MLLVYNLAQFIIIGDAYTTTILRFTRVSVTHHQKTINVEDSIMLLPFVTLKYVVFHMYQRTPLSRLTTIIDDRILAVIDYFSSESFKSI